ncbi:MAG TPA: hypothetical protein VJT32_08085 [bacterium]|nr:hypothetical protein [bacterium]
MVREDKPLTVKQAKFAARVAQGIPKATAHREIYANTEKHRTSPAQRRKAVEVAARPNVSAEIRRLTWLSCPPIDDIRGMREHSVRVLSDLSRTAKSEEVRLKSALALYRIAETTRAAAAPGAADSEQDRLLDSLRRLYVEVQGTADKHDGIGPAPPIVRYDDAPIDIRTLTVIQEPLDQEQPAEADPDDTFADDGGPDDVPQEPGDDAPHHAADEPLS